MPMFGSTQAMNRLGGVMGDYVVDECQNFAAIEQAC